LRRLTDRFAQAARDCSSLEELRGLVIGVSADLGFSHVALLHHLALAGSRGRHVRIDNYPPAWVDELVAAGFAECDPVHVASQRASSAFLWADLPLLIGLGPRERAILERSREFGLGEGMTVPVNVPGEPAGSCSFAVAPGQGVCRDQALSAELIGLHAFGAARRLAGLPRSGARPRLSRREIQCLRLVAGGKSDWETAMILGISVETARQYLKSARAAYDAVTRSQLVVLGLRDGWISFDDATSLLR
jgi:LuxR family quorum-sensing system transcriptional regulator CciR